MILKVTGLINETVRYVSPVIHMRKTSLEETFIGEQRIGPYEKFHYGMELQIETQKFLNHQMNLIFCEKMPISILLLVLVGILA